MQTILRPCLTIFALLMILTGAIYPGLVTVIGQVFFGQRANGSIIFVDGKAVGSELIGQQFDEPRYFWGRPSATTKDDKDLPYYAASSNGSNLGPTNPALVGGKNIEKEPGAIRERVKALQSAHGSDTPIPVDLVTSSASGLDPHITPAAAEYQIARIAKARGMAEDEVRRIVAAHIQGRTLSILGEPCVNVLRLNLALDAAQKSGKRQ